MMQPSVGICGRGRQVATGAEMIDVGDSIRGGACPAEASWAASPGSD